MLSSCLLRLACYSYLACSLLLAAAQLEHFGSRPVTKLWSKSAYPVPDLVPHRSTPVPDRSRSLPDRFHGIELYVPRGLWPVQNHLILFKSRIHTDYHDSIHSVPHVRNRHFSTVAFQTCGSPRNVPDPFIDPYPYIYIYICIFTFVDTLK